MITSKINLNFTPSLQQFFCFFLAKAAQNVIAREKITPWRHHIEFVCSQLYKRYIVFIEVCRGTKQRQRHGDTGITIIFFTVERVHNAWHQNTWPSILPFHKKLFSRAVKDLVILPILQEICKDKIKGLLC